MQFCENFENTSELLTKKNRDQEKNDLSLSQSEFSNFDISELKQATFLSHGRKPEVNISPARRGVSYIS